MKNKKIIPCFESKTLIEKAIKIASWAHDGQKDKGGAPYILHPLRVMGSLGAQASELEQIVAVLHDVLEDSFITLGFLKKQGFKDDVLNALELLTKNPGEFRLDNAERLSKNKTAIKVKLADVKDNMNLARIKVISQRDLNRMKQYQEVKDYLSQFIIE